MEFPRTTDIRLFGNKTAARELAQAHVERLLMQFRRFNELGGLQQNRQKVDFFDDFGRLVGTILMQTRFGTEQVFVEVDPRVIPEEKQETPDYPFTVLFALDLSMGLPETWGAVWGAQILIDSVFSKASASRGAFDLFSSPTWEYLEVTSEILPWTSNFGSISSALGSYQDTGNPENKGSWVEEYVAEMAAPTLQGQSRPVLVLLSQAPGSVDAANSPNYTMQEGRDALEDAGVFYIRINLGEWHTGETYFEDGVEKWETYPDPIPAEQTPAWPLIDLLEDYQRTGKHRGVATFWTDRDPEFLELY